MDWLTPVWGRWRTVHASVALFLLFLGALLLVVVLRDRAAAIEAVEERTLATARMLVAHAEGALEDASKILAAIDEDVRAWDLRESAQGQRINARLQALIDGSPQIYAVWVLDAEGNNRLDSRDYPPLEINAAGRAYFQAHLQRAPEPVIMGDKRPGAVSGKARFTFSRAQRQADGSLHAVLVASFLEEYFDRLYTETAVWPGARAGLYLTDGDILGRSQGEPRASPDFLGAVEQAVAERDAGSAMIPEQGGTRIASWTHSAKYPSIYASASQPVDAALARWWQRTLLLVTVAGFAGLGLVGLLVFAGRAAAAQREARLRLTLAREVDHRVKNSLQIVSSLLNLQDSQGLEPSANAAIAKAAKRVAAIAEVHQLIQTSADPGQVDACRLVHDVCRQVRRGTDSEIDFASEGTVVIDPARATNIAVIVNELATNALKHAAHRVEVRCSTLDEALVVRVGDDGPGLPADFDLRRQGRFGLSMAANLARHLGGSLAPVPNGAGTLWELRLPLAKLKTADRDLVIRRADAADGPGARS
ncbi:MAG: histidine kinase dimerization/phosphoacceptor domain -containing protein [Geminicoccaceae bacterium]